MHSALIIAAEEAAEHVNELPVSPVIFGVVAFGALMAGLLFTFAFRSVGTRH